jgi:hypothetical protein
MNRRERMCDEISECCVAMKMTEEEIADEICVVLRVRPSGEDLLKGISDSDLELVHASFVEMRSRFLRGGGRGPSPETGDTVYVGVALHMNGANWDDVVIGVFASTRLAKIGAEAYAKEHVVVEGGNGPVMKVSVCESSLNQHGISPVVEVYDVPSKTWS